MNNKILVLFISGLFLTTISSEIVISNYNSDSTFNTIKNYEIFNNYLPIELEIERITGGLFKINVEIINSGEENLKDIDWKISVEGGLFEKINILTEGTIQDLNPESKRILTKKRICPIFGECHSALVPGKAKLSCLWVLSFSR